MCRVQILLLLLALVVQICTPVFAYSIDDNRIDLPRFGDGSAPTTKLKGRMYGLCPPRFSRIGGRCYSISDEKKSWMDAHFYCKEKDGRLVEPNKRVNLKIRKYLADHFPSYSTNDAFWTGATYDWNRNVWQWGISGENLTFLDFEPLQKDTELDFHCAMFSPRTNYRWAAGLCSEEQRFICQHKLERRSKHRRREIYERWNVTFPNEYANEWIYPVKDRKSRKPKKTDDLIKNASENYASNLEYPYKPNHKNYYSTEIMSPSTKTGPKTKVKPTTGNPRQPTQYDLKLRRQRKLSRKIAIDKSKRSKSTATSTKIPTTTMTILKPENFEIRLEEVKHPQSQTNSDAQQPIDEVDPDVIMRKEHEHYAKKRKEAIEQKNREYEDQQRKKAELAKIEWLEKEKRSEFKNEQRIKNAQDEAEEYRKMEILRKRKQDEENIRLFEQQKKERLQREKDAEALEELRLQKEEEEEVQRLEHNERERLAKEQLKHEEWERNAAKKVSEAQRQLEAEQAAILEKEYEQQTEVITSVNTPPTTTTTTTTTTLATTKSPRWIEEDNKARLAIKRKQEEYLQRIAKLSPELQRELFEKRRQRKTLKKKNNNN